MATINEMVLEMITYGIIDLQSFASDMPLLLGTEDVTLEYNTVWADGCEAGTYWPRKDGRSGGRFNPQNCGFAMIAIAWPTEARCAFRAIAEKIKAAA